MERKLINWIEICKEKEIKLCNIDIKCKAKELSSFSDFKASKGWLNKIKKKFNLNFSYSRGEKIQKKEILDL